MFGLGGIIFVVEGAAFSSHYLSLVAWLVRHPISRICDYPHGNGFCLFMWCLRSLPETFHFLHSSHTQGLGNYPAVGIWLAQADGGLLCGGLIPPCSIVVLTSTQVLPTNGANCRVQIREVLHCKGAGRTNAWRGGKSLSSGLVWGWILLLLSSLMLHGQSFQES